MPQHPIQILQAEHADIRRRLDEMTPLFAATPIDMEAVVQQVEGLAQLLTLHERREEEVLFPAVEGMGPIQLVKQEHARLATVMDRMAAALDAARKEPSDDTAAALKKAVEEVAYCLSGHIMKEEQLAFRMAQAMLSPEQLAEMGERMAALS